MVQEGCRQTLLQQQQLLLVLATPALCCVLAHPLALGQDRLETQALVQALCRLGLEAGLVVSSSST